MSASYNQPNMQCRASGPEWLFCPPATELPGQARSDASIEIARFE